MGWLDGLKSLFGGGAPTEPTPEAQQSAIGAFWSWWADRRPQIEASVTSGLTPTLIQEISDMIDAIHPQMAWQFGAGTASTHAFTLTGEGDARLRVVAERWKAAGPGDDAVFAFRTTKHGLDEEALRTAAIGLGEANLAFADVRVEIVERDAARRLLHVSVYHPLFPTLPDPMVGQLTFLVLDEALGEDGVERWLGRVEPSLVQPDPGVDLVQLRAMAASWEGDADAAWVIGEGEHERTGQPCVYALNTAIKRRDHPLFDTRVLLRLPYASNPQGMPADSDVAPALDALVESLEAELGDAVVMPARRTGAGERQVWLYADGQSDVPSRIRTWAAACGRPASVEVQEDPLWEERP